MTRKEFDKIVEENKKELNFQNDWRSHGLEEKSFDEILTEIAQAISLDIDLIETVDIDEWIKEL